MNIELLDRLLEQKKISAADNNKPVYIESLSGVKS